MNLGKDENFLVKGSLRDRALGGQVKMSWLRGEIHDQKAAPLAGFLIPQALVLGADETHSKVGPSCGSPETSRLWTNHQVALQPHSALCTSPGELL